MPGKNKESEPEVKTSDFKRQALHRLRKDVNHDPDAGEAASKPEDDVEENEDVGSSQEEDESVVQNAESKTKKPKDEKDKGPPGLYPEIPVFDDHGDRDGTGSRSRMYAFRHVISILLAVVVCFLANTFLHSQEGNRSETESSVPLFDVDRIVSTLREDFGSLHEKNFRVLRAALRNVNTDVEPKAPAVLLVVSSEDDGRDRFATRLAELLHRSYVPLSGTELVRIKDSKKHIDDTIRESVEKAKARVFLVSQLQRWPFNTTMILHAYCDDQNATYKRVVYIVTVTCGPFDAATQWDRIAMDCLERSWPDAHKDMRIPLITRLTPSVMILQK